MARTGEIAFLPLSAWGFIPVGNIFPLSLKEMWSVNSELRNPAKPPAGHRFSIAVCSTSPVNVP